MQKKIEKKKVKINWFFFSYLKKIYETLSL